MPGARPSITGIGLVTPIGLDRDSFWDSLIHGTSGAREVRSFVASNLPNRIGCEVASYQLPALIGDGLPGGRCTELAAMAAIQAVESAGIDAQRDADGAVVVGTTMGEVTRFEQDRAAHPDDEPSVDDVRSLAQRPRRVRLR